MAADLYRDVAPIGIQDMKRVMIHVWHRLLPFQPMLGTDVPHWSLCARDQDQEHPLLNVGLFQMLFGDVMLTLPRTAVDQRNSRRLCPSAHATAETRPKICIQNDTIHAVVAAGEKILVSFTESVRHVHDVQSPAASIGPVPTQNSTLTTQNCFFGDCAWDNLPEGRLFRSVVSEKA